MTRPARITVTIDTLRVRGGGRADAMVLADALRASLREHLTANPGALTGSDRGAFSGSERLRLNVAAQQPAQRGREVGAKIGAALTGSKGRAR